MPRPVRRHVLANTLSALIAWDAALLISLVWTQWFTGPSGAAPGIALALAAGLFLPARRVALAVMAMADRYAGIPDTGEQIPSPGQSAPV